MRKSIPSIQNFFCFDRNIESDIIVDTVQDIIDSYFDKPKISISFSTTEESFNDLSFSDFENLLDRNSEEANLGSFHISEGDNIFSLVFQFYNENVGPNGNYSILLNDKYKNKNVEKQLWDDLLLKKYKVQPSLSLNQMIVEPLFTGRDFQINPKLCFVLMPFSEKWSDRTFRQIKDIVNSKGFLCKRADDLYGPNILVDIWSAINCAEIIIADITSRNPNVFYEIGIAHTIGKKVILLSQSKSDIPFDFLLYRHILYEDNIDGMEYLKKELPKYLL
jgi:hypothetical protein